MKPREPVLAVRVITTCPKRPGARVRVVLIPAMELSAKERARAQQGLPLHDEREAV